MEQEDILMITVGTLVLDMYDRDARQFVWLGQARRTIGSGNNSDDKKGLIDNAIERLLKNFAPNRR